MASGLEIMINAADLRCTICGSPRSVGCDCWEKCSCGWFARKGEPCNNSVTTRCSTKLKYGKYNRRTKRYERKDPPAAT